MRVGKEVFISLINDRVYRKKEKDPFGLESDMKEEEEKRNAEYSLLLSALYSKMGRSIFEPTKFVIEQPLVEPFGSKKTAFLNLGKVCKSMRRDPLHYAKFLETELGTHAFADVQGRYMIKGRFRTEQVINVTTNYLREYVICPTCKSFTTCLKKEGRLTFLCCEQCQTRVTVKSVEQSFLANTSRRAKR